MAESEIERIRDTHPRISRSEMCICHTGKPCDTALLLAEVDRLREPLKRAAQMLSDVAGDIEDGGSLESLRGKYVMVLVNARDDARAALSGSAKPKCRVCETQKAGLPTPGYTHDETCERAGSAKETR